LIIYLAVVASMIRLRYKNGEIEKGSFKVPFGLVVPLLAIVVIGWLLSHVKRQEIISIAIFFGVLTIFYFINAAIRKRNAVA
jgi:L-asparagine transporter-like permease